MLKAAIGPYDEFPEIDPIAARIDLASWKKELAANRALGHLRSAIRLQEADGVNAGRRRLLLSRMVS